jgi:hypothetical protein
MIETCIAPICEVKGVVLRAKLGMIGAVRIGWTPLVEGGIPPRSRTHTCSLAHSLTTTLTQPLTVVLCV